MVASRWAMRRTKRRGCQRSGRVGREVESRIIIIVMVIMRYINVTVAIIMPIIIVHAMHSVLVNTVAIANGCVLVMHASTCRAARGCIVCSIFLLAFHIHMRFTFAMGMSMSVSVLITATRTAAR